MNNCATRTIVSGVMGMGLGVCFGIFFGTMDSAVSAAAGARCSTPVHADPGACMQGMGAGSMAPPDPSLPKQTTGQVFRQMLTTTRQRSWCVCMSGLHSFIQVHAPC